LLKHFANFNRSFFDKLVIIGVTRLPSEESVKGGKGFKAYIKVKKVEVTTNNHL